MRLAVGIIFFNDAKSLERCISSLVDGVDIIIAIDGKFRHYPAKESFSTDGSRDIALSSGGSKIRLHDCPNQFEHNKRQYYLELSRQYSSDFLIIIDSDEFVIAERSDWREFKSNLTRIIIERDKGAYPVYSVKERTFGSEHQDQLLEYPRLWYKPYDMQYIHGRHFHFRHKDPSRINTPYEGNHAVDCIPGIVLGHDHKLRTKQHMDGRYQYAQWLTKYEGLPEYL